MYNVKKIVSCFILCALIFSLCACGKKSEDQAVIYMVNGVVYYDTGYKSSLDDRCEDMDGQITSECSASEVPTEDDQSNFGSPSSFYCC